MQKLCEICWISQGCPISLRAKAWVHKRAYKLYVTCFSSDLISSLSLPLTVPATLSSLYVLFSQKVQVTLASQDVSMSHFSVWSAFPSDNWIPQFHFFQVFCLNVIFSVNYCLLPCLNMQLALLSGLLFSSFQNIYNLL